MNLINMGKNIKKYDDICSKAPGAFAFLDRQNFNELQVFCHHIYEYRKGLRNLVLTTERAKNKEVIEKRLEKEKIPYVIHEITDEKINVYFGNQFCIDIVSTFDSQLNKLTPEQDFILGIMLGYDRLQQCDRYLKMRKKGLELDDLIG